MVYTEVIPFREVDTYVKNLSLSFKTMSLRRPNGFWGKLNALEMRILMKPFISINKLFARRYLRPITQDHHWCRRLYAVLKELNNLKKSAWRDRWKLEVERLSGWFESKVWNEPGKTRPVVVVQTDLLNDQHPSTIVCPLTTQIIRIQYSSDSSSNRGGSLTEKIRFMVDQLRAIDNRRFIKRLGWWRSSQKKLAENIRISLAECFLKPSFFQNTGKGAGPRVKENE